MSLPNKIKFVHPKTPTYFDCSPEGVTIHPGNTWVSWSDLWQESKSNVVEQLLDKIQSNSSKEYVVLFVRPGSFHCYNYMRHFSYQRHLDIAADVINADYKFPQQPDTYQFLTPSPPR